MHPIPLTATDAANRKHCWRFRAGMNVAPTWYYDGIATLWCRECYRGGKGGCGICVVKGWPEGIERARAAKGQAYQLEMEL